MRSLAKAPVGPAVTSRPVWTLMDSSAPEQKHQEAALLVTGCEEFPAYLGLLTTQVWSPTRPWVNFLAPPPSAQGGWSGTNLRISADN